MRTKIVDRAEYGLLLLDAVLLAIVELFFLPVRLGDIPFPITALLAALTLPLLVRRAAQLIPTTVGASGPLVAWLLVVLGIGLAGPGGDVVLIPDWRALALLGLGLLPAAISLGGALGKAVRSDG